MTNLIDLVFYIIAYFLLFSIFLPQEYEKRGDTLRTVILIIWMIQILLSMLLLVYWEIRDYNQLLLTSSLQYETKIDHYFRADWFTRFFLFGFSTLLFVRTGAFVMSFFSSEHNSPDRIVMYEVLSVGFSFQKFKIL